MGLLLLTLSSLLVSTFANYSINLKDPESSVVYNYDSPEDFTNALVKVKLNLDFSYYNGLFAGGNTGPLDILTVASPKGVNDLYDYLAFQLIGSGDTSLPPLLMVIISSPLASDNFAATTFCINLMPYDFADKLITVQKTGSSFTLDIEGLAQEPGAYHCQDYPGMESDTGRMELSTVKIGPNFVGCASLLEFPGVNLLPADTCGFPVQYFTGDITYFEGVCSNIPAESFTCPEPTTKPPTEPKPEPTKPKTEPIPDITEPKKKETEPKPTEKPTPEPETLPDPDTEDTEPDTEEEKPDEEEKEKETTPEEEEETEPTKKHEPEPEEEEKEDKPVVVVVPDTNDTEDKDKGDNEYEISDTEASTGDEGQKSNSVIIIICVVSAGIIVIVVLLYVGYRFHFRDKGSYKLEETKGEPQGEDFGNEYTDLNPTSKDQEWYL